MLKFLAQAAHNVHGSAFDANATGGCSVVGRGPVVSLCLGAVLATASCGNLVGYKKARLRQLAEAGEASAPTADAAADGDATPSSNGSSGAPSSGIGSPSSGATFDPTSVAEVGISGAMGEDAGGNPTDAVVVSTSWHAASDNSGREASTDRASEASVTTSVSDAGKPGVSSAEHDWANGTASSVTTGDAAPISSGEPRLACVFPQADCDDNAQVCETDLTSNQSCGESCEDTAVCDALSVGRCVNGGCSHAWAAWPMPNSGEVLGAPNPLSYTINDQGTVPADDDTVTDEVTGLMWQRSTSADTYTQPDALSYCEGLGLGGHADWRLPTRIELVSLLDHSRVNPAIDVDAFPATQPAPYWSASACVAPSDNAWDVHFYGGSADNGSVTGTNWVRCVR